MSFDITSVLKGVSGSDTKGGKEIVYLPVDKLDPDPDNFYSLAGIDELADSIALIGLQQPLLVRHGEEMGRYTVISGHRRLAAIQLLQDGEDDSAHLFDHGVPCIIDLGELNIIPGTDLAKALQELKLIYANSATRVLSAAEISKQAERIEALLYTLKDQGMTFPGRMRQHVAKICQVSQTKIARLHAIRENLVPDLLERFDAGQINEAVAYRISQEREPVQENLDWQLNTGWVNVDVPGIETLIRKIKNGMRTAEAASPKVTAEDGFNPEAYLQERAEEDENFFWMLQETADRYIPALREVKDRREGIETLKRTFKSAGGAYKMGILWDGKPNGLRLARGADHFDITRTWTDVYDMLSLIALRRAAKEEPKLRPRNDPSPSSAGGVQWSTGTPTERGMYETRIGVTDEDTPQTACWQRLEWYDGAWGYPKTHAPLPAWTKVYRWVKLPEV